MTTEEAIEILEERWRYSRTYKYTDAEIREAFDMAIQALEQPPCEDAISRQAVLNTLDYIDKILNEDRTVEHYKEMLKECYEILPPVTPTKPTGKWIDIGDEGLVFKCSLCGMKKTIESYFCPNCGARMEV